MIIGLDQEYQNLITEIKSYNPKADFKLIEKAYFTAKSAHEGQKRLSGEDYLCHPLAVARFLASWKLDSYSICSGLLHDVIEDGGKTLEGLEKNFNKEIAELVDGVTKIGELKFQSSAENEFVENLRKMLVVMARDLRVVLIKLADRYHNMRTLSFLPLEKQKRIARETLEVYAPLAERLGIGELKGSLEDLAFPYCYPEDYAWLVSYSAPFFKETERLVNEAIKIVNEELEKENIKAQVQGRVKHLYSLWRKLLRPEVNKDITKIYDIVAMRILVSDIRDCYGSLGVVHKLWKPVPSEGISDFIAVPKPNGYRSIHTKIFGPEGKIIEVQIRTFQMHDEAENGIAAHWFYSQAKGEKEASDKKVEQGFFAPTEKLTWVKQLVSWQEELVDSKEFMEALKFDALGHRIFVFSPKGDVFDLPKEATTIDFAYAVHTDLGDKAIGAKVNGKMVSLETKLNSGQIVEILTTNKKTKPSRSWLDFVVTNRAKSEILKHYRGETKKN
jgi:guanosine-3',5'-bis(diphosphate) 3'-pyrophosphohydrolase